MKYVATLVDTQTGEVVECEAYKENGFWIVGGERASASTELGFKIFLTAPDGSEFYLKGNRLIRQ